MKGQNGVPMEQQKKQKRARRKFTEEFKTGAARLVLDEGKSVSQVARDLDLTLSALSAWVKQAHADRSDGKMGLTTAEREELVQLRKENRRLKTERDLLKKWAAFFAKEAT
jgi:transposase